MSQLTYNEIGHQKNGRYAEVWWTDADMRIRSAPARVNGQPGGHGRHKIPWHSRPIFGRIDHALKAISVRWFDERPARVDGIVAELKRIYSGYAICEHIPAGTTQA